MSIQATSTFVKAHLSADILAEWQELIDTTAAIFGVPAGLITRVEGNQFEVLLSSHSTGNPYSAGMASYYPNSGWYCEKTLKLRGLHLIPDARQDPEWKDNGAVRGFGMVSYLGMPILLPDSGLFGTVCFIDNKANPHNETHKKMVGLIARMMTLSMRTLADRTTIADQERLFKDLSRLYPICSYCKNVRDDKGSWVPVESYVLQTTGAVASHGVCPKCITKATEAMGLGPE